MGKRYKVGDVFFDACGDGLRRYTVTRASSSALDASSVRIGRDRMPIIGTERAWSGSNPPGLRTARRTMVGAQTELVLALEEEADRLLVASHNAERELEAELKVLSVLSHTPEPTPTEVAPDA